MWPPKRVFCTCLGSLAGLIVYSTLFCSRNTQCACALVWIQFFSSVWGHSLAAGIIVDSSLCFSNNDRRTYVRLWIQAFHNRHPRATCTIFLRTGLDPHLRKHSKTYNENNFCGRLFCIELHTWSHLLGLCGAVAAVVPTLCQCECGPIKLLLDFPERAMPFNEALQEVVEHLVCVINELAIHVAQKLYPLRMHLLHSSSCNEKQCEYVQHHVNEPIFHPIFWTKCPHQKPCERQGSSLQHRCDW